ncbi:MAG: hypothetical protein M1834_005650 [Cirrosporium novae-zelandiae]|nr:MAG: hypothetical protein M1834_005650 [Cirrosporium novae-zelandiae]
MMMHFLASAALVALSARAVLATDCDTDNQCPESAPCCSQYGECGVGAYCLGGCDPLSSYSLDACVPEPVCVDKTFTKFKNTDNIMANTKYLGASSETDWVSSGTPLVYNGNLLLTMPQNSTGTLLTSTSYVWYGKISAKLKTSRGAGVVTAFIFLSNVKDEIDYEFVGVELETAQTNYYFQGIENYDNGKNITTDSNTYKNFHTYEIDWQPDEITWSVDGEVGRTLKKSDTWNSTSNRYEYPQTPALVELSLWPAGLSTNAAGTISWAGGEIDWDSEDIQNYGYYYATFAEVNITCYDAPSNANKTGDNSYIYTDDSGLNTSVAITDDKHVLASLEATGLNMSVGESSSSSNVANVPGVSNAGAGAAANSATAAASSGSSSSSSSGSSSSGFSQGTGDTNSAPAKTEKVMQSSLFAILIALMGMIAL